MEELPPYTASPVYEEELPKLPIEMIEKIMSFIPVINVFTLWHPEGGCSGGDGTSELKFLSTMDLDEWSEENQGLLNYCYIDGNVSLSTGQILLVTTEYNLRYSCCSGYQRITLDVFDHESDLTDYPYPNDNGQDGYNYEIYYYIEALDMV